MSEKIKFWKNRKRISYNDIVRKDDENKNAGGGDLNR